MALLAHALCTVAQATNWIRPIVDPITNDTEEAVLEQLINAVTERFEREVGRPIKGREATYYLDGTGRMDILLPHTPVVEIADMWSLDEDRSVSETYIVLDGYYFVTPAGRLYLAQQGPFPKGIQNIKIAATFGWSTVPTDINVGACQWVADWFKAWVNKRDNIESINFSGVSAFIRSEPIPLKVKPLIDLYRCVAGASV